jgi:hypothetical protein
MRTSRSGQGPERTRAVGRPKSTHPAPAPTKTVAHPRPPRDWAKQNARLVARGDVDIWVDWNDVVGRGDGPGSGSGRPYPTVMIALVVVLMALDNLALRQAEGRVAREARRLGLVVTTPDHSTLCRRRRGLDWDPPRLRRGQVIVIDATGITVRSTGPWLSAKSKDPRKARFVKLHAGVDQQTGEIVSHVVTPGDGALTGDVSLGPRLIRDAGRVVEQPAGVLADRAYDAKSCYQAARDVGSELFCVPKDNAARGLHPDRDTHLAQIGRLGPPRWKKRVGYGQRGQVESVFSALKRTTSDRTRARSFEGAVAEINARVWLHNRVLELYPIR